MKDYRDICLRAVEAVRASGEFIRKERENFSPDAVHYKGANDLVSYVDKTSEKMLVEALSQILPESGFIGEEGISDKRGEHFNWIIDPLDGTTNFVHALPVFAVSVALREDDELVVGIVYEVNRDEMFYTWKDAPAYLNGNPVSVSDNHLFDHSLLAFGTPCRAFEGEEAFYRSMSFFIREANGIRRVGSAATDLAYVAAGRVEGYWEPQLHIWDIAAGVLLVKNAGGVVCDFKGGEDYLVSGDVIAGNRALFDAFSSVILREVEKG